jgi:hypothetical protein
LLILTWLVVGCENRASNIIFTLTSTPIIAAGTTESSPIYGTPSSTITPILPTPTARIFADADNCTLPINAGHILFLESSFVQNSTSYDGLYVMDGNACSASLLMVGYVFGTPAWSTDGKQISIGCDNGSVICILDAHASLDGCLNLGNFNGVCTPVILRKYALPPGSGKYIFNTSWTYDNKRMVVESRETESRDSDSYVNILTLAGNGSWKLVMHGTTEFNAEASPVTNEMLFDGNYIMSLDGGPISRYTISGYRAVWSHDGTKIAFLQEGPYVPTLPYTEPVGIAEWNFLKTPHWNWLYEPKPIDKYYWPPQNYFIDLRDYPALSWSWDGKYLAFEGEGGSSREISEIYRLNVMTGEIEGLTTKFGQGYAPAWGP